MPATACWLLLFCGCLAAVEDPVATALSEAEALGFPRLAGTTVVAGPLRLADETQDPYQDRSWPDLRWLHARLDEDNILVDLIYPTPITAIEAADVAGLRRCADVRSPASGIFPNPWYDRRGRDLLLAARWRQLGVHGADAVWRRVRDDSPPSENGDTYPRRERGRDDGLVVRWALARWFLGEWPGGRRGPVHRDAALAILPPAWRPALSAELALAAELPSEAPPGPGGILAAWQPPSAVRDLAAAFPELGEADLVALAGDRHPVAGGGATVGDRALAVLEARWDIDPAWCAGRDALAPWDDSERAAVAAGLAAWWERCAGMGAEERLAEVISRLPPDRLAGVLFRRRSRISGWNPNRPPTDFDNHVFVAALDRRLGTAWAGGLPLVSPRAASDLLELVHGLPHGGALIAAWPRNEATPVAVLAYDDATVASAAIDRRVEAWLRDPAADEAMLFHPYPIAGLDPDLPLRMATVTPLAWWVAHPDARRWARITELLAADPARPATARLLAACGAPWHVPNAEGTWVDPPTVLALAWLALGDTRPAPPGAVQLAHVREEEARQPFPLPEPLRICDLAAVQVLGSLDVLVPLSAGPRLADVPCIQAALQDPAHAELRSLIPELRSRLAPLVRDGLTRIGLALPPGLEAGDAVQGVVQPAGLTPAESAACTAVLAEARGLGFPDLAKASVLHGQLVTATGSWSGAHIHLADGSWLASCVVPLPAAAVVQAPSPGHGGSWTPDPGQERLTQELARRSRCNLRLGDEVNEPAHAGIVALTAWAGGADPSGCALVEAAIVGAVSGIDRGLPLVLASAWTPDGRDGPPVVMIDPAKALRGACARWFLERLPLAATDPEADDLLAAAEAILAEGDREAWRPLLEQHRFAHGLAHARPAPANAVLAERLATWTADMHDPATGRWQTAGTLTLTDDDIPGLIALCGNRSPSCWLDGGVPRTVGDQALRALAQLTQVDWRWLVVDDPRVILLLPPLQPGDGRLRWHRVVWDDVLRQAVAVALRDWWKDHAGDGALAARLGVLRRLPLSQWQDLWQESPDWLLQPAAADAIAGRITAPAIGDLEAADSAALSAAELRLQMVFEISLKLPGHAGIGATIAAWPDRVWRDDLLALRSQLAGGAAFDARILAYLHGRLLKPERDSWRYNLHPAGNLGLWVFDPTPARLEALRACQRGDLGEPATLSLLAAAGSMAYTIYGSEDEAFRIGKAVPEAVPARLTLDALEDRRLLPAAALARMAEDLDDGPLAAGWRVCDWVALHLGRQSDRPFAAVLPPLANDPVAFAKAQTAERDQAIALIRAELAPEVELLLGDVGLGPKPVAPENRF